MIGLPRTVDQLKTDVDRLAGVCTAVAVIGRGNGGRIEQPGVVQPHAGRRQLGQRREGIHHTARSGNAAHDEPRRVDVPLPEIGPHQRRHAGNHGRCHRRAAPLGILIPRQRAVDGYAGRHDLVTGIREGRGLVLGRRGLDTQHIRQGGGIMRSDRFRQTVVARCGYQHGLVQGNLQRVLHDLRAGVTAEAHVDHVGAIVYGIQNALGNVVDRQHPAVLRRPDRHDPHVESHPHAALAVESLCRDDPRHVRAVAVIVDRVAAVQRGVRHHAGPVDVVLEAVAVVVDAVARNFAGVDPHVGLQFLVVVVHARVDDGHHNVLRPARIDPVVIQAVPSLPDPDIFVKPLLVVSRVGGAVRQSFDYRRDLVRHAPHVIRLGRFHLGHFAQGRQRFFHVRAFGQIQPVPAAEFLPFPRLALLRELFRFRRRQRRPAAGLDRNPRQLREDGACQFPPLAEIAAGPARFRHVTLLG